MLSSNNASGQQHARASRSSLDELAVCAISRQGMKAFGFPREAKLLANSFRCKRTRLPVFQSGWLPITHQVDAWRAFDPTGVRAGPIVHDAHYYYYGRGCSDVFLRAPAESMLVANNRIDAALRLLAQKHRTSAERAVPVLYKDLVARRKSWAKPICNLTGRLAMRRIMALDVCTQPWLRKPQEWAQSTCLHRWQEGFSGVTRMILGLMRQLRIETVVLLHEAPGALPDLREWKTEILRAVPFDNETLYDAHLRPCPPQTVSAGAYGGRCVFCERSPMAADACGFSGRPTAAGSLLPQDVAMWHAKSVAGS